jgi:hypothetical protein
MSPLERLRRLALLKPDSSADPRGGKGGPSELLSLCHSGALVGGLSVALDVRPDELIGPLAMAIGGRATELKVIDVRDQPRPELTIRLANVDRTWPVEDLGSLAQLLNELFKGAPATKAVAVLGEWEDALQLWALDKTLLKELLRESFFRPHNRRQLAALAHAPTSC